MKKRLKKRVVTHNSIEGYHHYPDPPKEVSFLQYPHRHLFEIRCQFEVSDSNREVEIFIQQSAIDMIIRKHFGKPAEFGHMSCEMIGEWILNEIDNCVEVEVLEDGHGGAIIQR
ncbi:MAG: hypothetical protein WCQ59_09455 [Candidatus Cloacimonadaceae bacterium]